jgi:hypothetical protein
MMIILNNLVMPVLFVTRFHYLVDHEKLRQLAMDRELEDHDRNYHWKIHGINEEKSLITTIYLFDTMEQAMAQKQEVDIIAELQSEANDMREYEFYEVMVDQSLLCKAPILMTDLGTKRDGAEALFYYEGLGPRILK